MATVRRSFEVAVAFDTLLGSNTDGMMYAVSMVLWIVVAVVQAPQAEEAAEDVIGFRVQHGKLDVAIDIDEFRRVITAERAKQG